MKRQKPIQQFTPEQEKYLKAYYDNEYDANRQMSFANAFSAFILIIIFILYVTKVFELSENTYPYILITFPIDIVILLTPSIYALFFKKILRKPNYKLFVTFSLIFVAIILNLVLPKHSILIWALCIVLTNHYYNPKLCRIVFVSVLFWMLISMYGAMFVGEYDPNYLGYGVVIDGKIEIVDGVKNRFDMLHQMILEGENRYIKVFAYYYIPRAAIISLIFIVCNSLNMRTYKLLVSEIQVSSDQQKTKTELEVAKDIQLATLPLEFATRKDVELQAELKAAKEVGGDFYDYYRLGESHVAFVIGDVSGKGIPAAMFMMKTITCFKNYISLSKTPAEILKLVNKTINIGNESKMFVTCFLAILDTKTGVMKYANAGHNPPIIGQKQNYQYLKCNSGFLLGCFPDAYVKDEEITLNNGDTITLYTDGITEAMNNNKELYGEKRLLNFFNRKKYSTLLELHHDLKDDIAQFVGDAEQSDDMTYLTLKFHGDEYYYEEKNFLANPDNIPQILDFLKQFAKNEEFEHNFANNLLIVGDEICSNIVKFAYKHEDGDIYIRLLYNINEKEFVFTIIDKGEEFNPFDTDAKPLDGDISDRPVGGLGILIVKQLMSEHAYDRINGKNIVTLKKKFE